MNLLEQFPKGVHPFLEGDSQSQFFETLTSIPEWEERLQLLFSENPSWLEEAYQHGVYFFKEEVNKTFDNNSLPEISLCSFQMGQYPTVKLKVLNMHSSVINRQY